MRRFRVNEAHGLATSPRVDRRRAHKATVVPSLSLTRVARLGSGYPFEPARLPVSFRSVMSELPERVVSPFIYNLVRASEPKAFLFRKARQKSLSPQLIQHEKSYGLAHAKHSES